MNVGLNLLIRTGKLYELMLMSKVAFFWLIFWFRAFLWVEDSVAKLLPQKDAQTTTRMVIRWHFIVCLRHSWFCNVKFRKSVHNSVRVSWFPRQSRWYCPHSADGKNWGRESIAKLSWGAGSFQGTAEHQDPTLSADCMCRLQMALITAFLLSDLKSPFIEPFCQW